jgi:hypothetical protein
MSIDFRALEDLNVAETYLLTTSAFRENWLNYVNEADMVSADRLCVTLVASLGRGLARRSTRSQRASVVVGNSARSGLLEVIQALSLWQLQHCGKTFTASSIE